MPDRTSKADAAAAADAAAVAAQTDYDAVIAAKDAEIADLKAKLGEFVPPRPPIQEYPKWVTDGKEKRVVQTPEEHKALGQGWA